MFPYLPGGLYYPDDVGGENPMPWVRLHAAKDYWGMAMLLSEVPELHATINLVPSLLLQLTAYTDRGAKDEHLRVSRTPAEGFRKPTSSTCSIISSWSTRTI